MIDPELTRAFNQRPKLDINNLKKMTPSQKDGVKSYGSAAENLLANKDFALFVHHFKFDLADELGNIQGHTQDDNARRISIAHNLAGIDKFVAQLQRAVWYKNKVVTLITEPTDD